MKQFTDLIPRKVRRVSAGGFLKLSKQEKLNIKSCRFDPPSFGSGDFGKFTLTLKTPFYSIDNGDKE